jgi:gliding motility-associated-like protein
MNLDVLHAPDADAGTDAATCENIPYQVTDADTSFAGGVNWEILNGNGSLDDPGIIDPTYTPDASDAGTDVQLVLHALGNGNCAENTDTMTISVLNAPMADAGSDASTCENVPYQVNDADTSYTSSINWEIIGGNGSLDDPGIIDPTYTPDASDAGTTVSLVLHAGGNGNCAEDTDTMRLDILHAPIADAGSDAATCEDVSYHVTDADTSNASGLNWEIVNGNGSLDDPNIIDPTYTPDASDAGSNVQLVIHALGNGNCAEDTDTMNLAIYELPTANAGSDATTCENVAYHITDADTTNSDGVNWEILNGNGSLDDPGIIDPTYNPVASDAGTTVQLVLHGSGYGNCSEATDTMNINVLHAPVADAGDDAETCENVAYQITTADSSYASSINWEIIGGNGSLDDPGLIDPTYTPDATDAGNTVQLVLHVSGNGNCSEATDTMNLDVLHAPDADAGTDAATCENIPYQVTDADTSFAGGVNWEILNGNGSLDDPGIIDPTYTPDASDAGTDVQLVLHALGNGNCAENTDTMTISVLNAPMADAGSDASTCENVPYQVNDADTSYTSSINWEIIGGNGSLDDPGIIDPTYTPDASDAGTTVSLVLHAGGNGNCAEDTDTMRLDIVPEPTVDAGLATDSICYDGNYTLSDADTSNVDSLAWTTSGDGSFDNANAINPTYSPGEADRDSGYVYLYLEAFGSSNCTSVRDSLRLIIPPELIVGIGSPRPFTIDSTTTEIEVMLGIRDHQFIDDLHYYIVTPKGQKILLGEDQSLCGDMDVDLTFTNQTPYSSDVCGSGTYGIKGNWEDLHGKDPANGTWSIIVGDDRDWTGADTSGHISKARITFIDEHDNTGDTINVTYEADTLHQPIQESSGGGSVANTPVHLPNELQTSCFGGCDATAVLFTNGGTKPYQKIQWSSDRNFNNIISTSDTTDLCAGKYYVRVIDALNCIDVDSVTVIQPPEIIIDSLEVLSIGEQNGCRGDSIGQVHDSAYGGTGTLQYELIKDPYTSPDTIGTNTTGDFTGLAAGFYMLEVFDDNGCIKDTTFNITQPDPIQITYENYTSLTAPGASDGTIDIYAEGGTAPLTYTLYDSIPNPDTVVTTVTTTDTAHFTNLPESDYYVLVNDANGCDTTQSSIFRITPMQMNLSIDETICPGDSSGVVYAEVIGGISPYTYQWTTLPSNDTIRELIDTSTTEDTLRNVPAGNYVLNVIDDNGFNIRDTIEVPGEINIDSISVRTSPYGLDVWSSGGNDSLYVYLIREKADTTLYPDNATYNPGNSSTFAAFNDLDGDTYKIIATDSICQADTLKIKVPITVELSIRDSIQCNGDENGSLRAEVSGADNNKPYTYEWSDGTVVNSSDTINILEDLDAGTYSVKVTDNYGLSDSATITISDPPAFNIFASIDSAYCEEGQFVYGNDKGAIYLNVTGGRPYGTSYNYKYSWGNSSQPIGGLDSLTNVGSGNHSVTVHDRYGCQESASFNIPVSETHKLEANAGIVTHNGTSMNKRLKVCPYDSIRLEAVSLTNTDSAYWQVFQDDFIPVEDFSDTLPVSAREDLVYYLIARNEKCKDVVRAGMTEFHPSPELRFTSFNNRDVRNKDSVNVLEKHETATITAEAIDSIATGYTWGDDASFFQSVDELSAVLNIEAVQDAGLNETRVSIETETEDTSEVSGEICSFRDQLLVSIIPNVDPVDAFSPNGDGNNDKWLLEYGSNYPELEVIIFNRWGIEVFRKKGDFETYNNFGNEYVKVWDGKTKGGKDLPTGTYYYIIDPHVTGVKILRGTVTLIR